MTSNNGGNTRDENKQEEEIKTTGRHCSKEITHHEKIRNTTTTLYEIQYDTTETTTSIDKPNNSVEQCKSCPT